MFWLWYAVIHVTSSVVSYFMFRHECRVVQSMPWTVGLRRTVAAVSLVGGPFVAACILFSAAVLALSSVPERLEDWFGDSTPVDW